MQYLLSKQYPHLYEINWMIMGSWSVMIQLSINHVWMNSSITRWHFWTLTCFHRVRFSTYKHRSDYIHCEEEAGTNKGISLQTFSFKGQIVTLQFDPRFVLDPETLFLPFFTQRFMIVSALLNNIHIVMWIKIKKIKIKKFKIYIWKTL